MRLGTSLRRLQGLVCLNGFFGLSSCVTLLMKPYFRLLASLPNVDGSPHRSFGVLLRSCGAFLVWRC